MKKQPHVPETRQAVKPNREQRRHPEKLDPETFDAEQAEADKLKQAQSEESGIMQRSSADELSTRAKSTAHKKHTAENWNQ